MSMTSEKKPVVDTDLDQWLKAFMAVYALLVVGTEMGAEQPGPALFAMSLVLCVVPAVFLGAIVVVFCRGMKALFTA